MHRAWMLAALLVLPAVTSGQAVAVLRVTVSLPDAAANPTPIPRHALLISDNPPTAAPRRVVTRTDGTIEVRLQPGSYIVESDRPVNFQGRAYLWTQVVNVAAGQDLALELTATNAEVVEATADPPAAGAPEPSADASALLARWQESVVVVWSPTSRATGFVIDPRGLIATDRTALGSATSVEVQVSESVKVPGRVMATQAAGSAALVRVPASVVSGRAPLPLECPPPQTRALDDGDEVMAIVSPLGRMRDATWGEVTALAPLAIETDLRVGFGGAGGPVFDAAGAFVGLTTVQPDAAANRRSDVAIVRAGVLCGAVSAARAQLNETAATEATPLPVEPARGFPASALDGGRPADGGALTVSSSDFDVAFVTPPMVHDARQRADRSGGAATRSPEAEARLGRITDFGAWSEYFADTPPVLVIRVTPKLVEGFWKRLAREAARTQGANLPPFKDFKTSFLTMRASCGGAEVVPIHPFVLEHRMSEKDLVREGLYVFDPGALGPHCGTVTLALTSERAPNQGETVTIEPALVERVWQDFAPYRAAGG